MLSRLTGRRAGDPDAVAWAGSIAGLVLTLWVLVRVARHEHVIGALNGDWAYPYFRDFRPALLLPWLAALVAVPVVMAGARRLEHRATLVVVLTAAVGFVLQPVLRMFAFAPMGTIIRSDASNGFYSPTLRIGAWDFLTNHPTIVNSLPAHAQTNMPGKVMLFYLLELVSKSPAMIATLIVGLSTLGAVLVYRIARELKADRRAALLGMALYLVLPGRLAFNPVVNTITPLLSLGSFWLFLVGMRRTSAGYLVAAGAAVYLMAFFEPLALAMGLAFVAALADDFLAKGRDWRRAGLMVLAPAAGFLAVYLGLRLAAGYDLFANFSYVLHDAKTFNARSHRPYLVWLVANMKELSASAGLSLLVIIVLGAVPRLTRRDDARSMRTFAWACLAILVILDLLGINRGEVARLWIFLACALTIVAGHHLGRARTLVPWAIVFLAMALQAVVQVGMIAFVIP